MRSPTDRSRLVRAAGMLLAVMLGVAACEDAPEVEPDVVIGVGSTAEQRALAGLAAVGLQRSGLEVEVRSDLGGTVELRRELQSRRIDLAWDYTGAAWSLGLGQQAPPADPTESFERVREADRRNDLTWLGPSRADATLAFFVRPVDAPPDGERTMTWLAGQLSSGEWSLCVDPAYRERPAGLAALADAYTIDRLRLDPRLIDADETEAVEGVAARRCFAGLATATSGAAHNAGLVRVTDDRRVFPAFVVAPIVRDDVLVAHPEVGEVLEIITELLDTDAVAELTAAVEREVDPTELAEAFLAEVLPAPPEDA